MTFSTAPPGRLGRPFSNLVTPPRRFENPGVGGHPSGWIIARPGSEIRSVLGGPLAVRANDLGQLDDRSQLGCSPRNDNAKFCSELNGRKRKRKRTTTPMSINPVYGVGRLA